MDDKTQKERLGQELRFLKESFEAEVISKEEFEKGKDRIEKKLKDIERSEKESAKEQTQEKELKKKQEQVAEQKEKIETAKAEEQKNDEAIEKKEAERIKLNIIQDETEIHAEPAPEIEQKVAQESAPQKQVEIEEQKKEGKFFKYAIVFVVLVLVVFFSYSLLKSDKDIKKTDEMKFVAACSSNDDCKQEGKEGICVAPGTKNAMCEFEETPKTNIIILNDRKNCFNCDTQRVLGILEDWFSVINAKEVDYSTNEGKAIAEKLDLNMLPAYILDENITKKPSYGQFKQAFIKEDSSYILSEDASGSTFYFRRDNVPNKLDLFVKENDTSSINAEKNLKELLDNFKEVQFEKHSSDSTFAKELGIKTFPTFLVSNQIKFSGVLTAEMIKNNFCKLNKLPECEKSLSKSLV